ncbi:MAG: hypothetical protein AAFY56_22310, partial [Pseudomonadota bacterium]
MTINQESLAHGATRLKLAMAWAALLLCGACDPAVDDRGRIEYWQTQSDVFFASERDVYEFQDWVELVSGAPIIGRRESTDRM